MSIVFLDEHNESIYDTLKKANPYVIEPPRYKSKYTAHVRAEAKQNKDDHRLFGYAHYSLPKPDQYLKKNTGVRVASGQRTPCQNHGVKHRDEQNHFLRSKSAPVKRESTDFITKNIQDACRLEVKTGKRRYVDTPKGDAHDLEPSGLQVVYMGRKSYGKTPGYILRMMREREKEMRNKREEKDSAKSMYRYVSETERMELLAGLKRNYEQMQKDYLRLPILTDTIAKMNRKARFEDELKRLERDIGMVERHAHIYVYEC